MAGYVCQPCGEMETAKHLVISTLAGWWSVPSWFYAGWRSLWANWRSAFTFPAEPLRWGAIPTLDLFSNPYDDSSNEGIPSYEIPDDSPLSGLSHSDLMRVIEAEGLYGILGIQLGANPQEIRAAFRQKSKEFHPDLNPGSAEDAGRRMSEINEAWAILGNEELRVAYDWTVTSGRRS